MPSDEVPEIPNEPFVPDDSDLLPFDYEVVADEIRQLATLEHFKFEIAQRIADEVIEESVGWSHDTLRPF